LKLNKLHLYDVYDLLYQIGKTKNLDPVYIDMAKRFAASQTLAVNMGLCSFLPETASAFRAERHQGNQPMGLPQPVFFLT